MEQIRGQLVVGGQPFQEGMVGDPHRGDVVFADQLEPAPALVDQPVGIHSSSADRSVNAAGSRRIVT